MIHIDMMAWMMVVMACSTTFRNLGDGSNYQIAPRFQERIQPHWDRTLFSLITTSRHLKVIWNNIKPIMSKSLQSSTASWWNCINLEKTHWKKTTWIFIEVIMVMRIQRPWLCVLHFVQTVCFIVDFWNPVGFSISIHKIIKSLKSNGRNPNHICLLVVNSDIIWMFL